MFSAPLAFEGATAAPLADMSFVWNFFDKTSEKIACRHCEWTAKVDKSASTGNLWTHLVSQHGLNADKLKSAFKEASPSSSGLTQFFKPKSDAEMKMHCVMLVALDLRPFSIFEGDGPPLFLLILCFL